MAGEDKEREKSEIQEKTQYIPGMDYVLKLSQEKNEPYKIMLLGKEFIVLPGVFSPAYYAETAFYTQHVVDLLKPGEDYLDLGCGAGVTTVMAALKGVNVTSLDINLQAVGNTKRNVGLHKVADRVRVMQSDVYSALTSEDKFDTIYWNVPFGFREEGTRISTLEEAIYDPGYRKNREFITGARDHLKIGGQLLMGVSSTLGDLEAVERFASEAGLKFIQIAEMIGPDAFYEIKFQLLKAKV